MPEILPERVANPCRHLPTRPSRRAVARRDASLPGTPDKASLARLALVLKVGSSGHHPQRIPDNQSPHCELGQSDQNGEGPMACRFLQGQTEEKVKQADAKDGTGDENA